MKDKQSEIAERIAIVAHTGQFRRDGVTPYIEHPRLIAKKLSGEPDETIAVAWLHDVLEDTDFPVETMRQAGVSEPVLDAVRLLTRPEDKSYTKYMKAIRTHPVALKVKVADMLHNLSDTPTEYQVLKYAKGLLILLDNPKPNPVQLNEKRNEVLRQIEELPKKQTPQRK